MTYYRTELARIHHEAFGDYADLAAPGILQRIPGSTQIIELGCGSGSLTRHLLDAGKSGLATDASLAMVDIAAIEVPEATPRVLTLPDDPIPQAEAVVALGHVFNYLERGDIGRGLRAAADAGQVLVTDVLDLSYGKARPFPVDYFHEGDGWKLWTVNRLETPDLVVREMRIETDDGVTEETHRNVLVDAEAIAKNLANRYEVTVSDSFGTETLPPGFRVLEVRS